jgi:hypothetical protein
MYFFKLYLNSVKKTDGKEKDFIGYHTGLQ